MLCQSLSIRTCYDMIAISLLTKRNVTIGTEAFLAWPQNSWLNKDNNFRSVIDKWILFRLCGELSSPISRICGVLGSYCGKSTPSVAFPTPGYLSMTWWSTWRMATRWRRLRAAPPRCSTSWRMWVSWTGMLFELWTCCVLFQAWNLDPEKRPTFVKARDSLEKFKIQNPQWFIEMEALSHLRWPLSQGVIVIPNWTSPRPMTTFLFHLNNNNKMPKPVIMQIPQPTYCSDIVLTYSKSNGIRSPKSGLYTFCILFPDHWSSQPTLNILKICILIVQPTVI